MIGWLRRSILRGRPLLAASSYNNMTSPKMNDEYLIWSSEVRNYEIDYQGIVNNANYFHYLDQARSNYLESIGINLKKFADKNLNILMETKQKCKELLALSEPS